MSTFRQYALPKSLVEWENVSVSWQDAHETDGAHNSAEYLADFKPVLRRSAGYVLRYDDEYLIIAGTDDRDGVQTEDKSDCERIFSIPLCMIRRIKRDKGRDK